MRIAEQKAAPGLPLSARVVYGVLLVLEVVIAIFALEAMHLATWPAFDSDDNFLWRTKTLKRSKTS